MQVCLIVDRYDDQTICVLKFWRKTSPSSVSVSPTKEREWWFWFRKMVNTVTNHIPMLAGHPGRLLGLGFKEFKTNCYNLTAAQADSSDYIILPPMEPLQRGQLCGLGEHHPRVDWYRLSKVTPRGSTKQEQQQTSETNVLPALDCICPEVNRSTGRERFSG